MIVFHHVQPWFLIKTGLYGTLCFQSRNGKEWGVPSKKHQDLVVSVQ